MPTETTPMLRGDVELSSSAPSSGNAPNIVAAETANGDGSAADHRRDEASTGASSASSSSSYKDESDNDLNVLSGAALITADCMGTGVLALPADMKVLGMAFGLTFLILNLPINLYAGTILSRAATYVEGRLGEAQLAAEEEEEEEAVDDDSAGNGDAAVDGGDEEGAAAVAGAPHSAVAAASDGRRRRRKVRTKKRSGYSSVEASSSSSSPATAATVNGSEEEDAEEFDDEDGAAAGGGGAALDRPSWEAPPSDDEHDRADGAAADRHRHRHKHSVHRHARVHTYDFLGMTTALFEHPATSPYGAASVQTWPTKLVTAVFYTNIFLVLGNYILVMSHSVAAVVGEENICLPTAGIAASVLMYALSQIRTMANLGRSASVISLTALFIVVAMCLASIERGDEEVELVADDDRIAKEQEINGGETYTVVRQLSALASVGFAVGSQKLLLNIRHEMAERERDTPRALGLSLLAFGAAYVTVCVLAGPDPPSFLLDAIGAGAGRRVAGFLLWVHVAVSFAINSQALTSSIDRVGFHRVRLWGLHDRHRARWALLTLLIAVSSYTVANAVPFFKDLVALIGALTSVPLTLLLPAVLHRRVIRVPVLKLGSRHDAGSYLLVAFSLAFVVAGLAGVLDSIEMDWASKGRPFACH